MYRVLCDGLPIYDLRDEELVLFDPKATLEVNTAGSFNFKMPPNHPQYDLPKKMRSCVEIWHDEEQIFAGRPISDDLDFYNRKNVKCEGQLAYLNDSIQRPAEYHDMTVRGYLETLIAVHNSQVDESRQFEVGIVTVKDNNDSLYRYTNYNSTWTEIKEDLIDDLGGYIRVRNHNGHRYIDYIEDFDNVCSQSIEFGENLLDCSRNTDLTDIATAVIPLGCRLEESDIAALEKRLTIESVNNGLDYIVNAEAVAKYGFIVKTVTWDDVTTPEMLLYKGKRWLESEQYENMVIDVKAVDLHYTDEQIEQFKLFDLIPVHSTPHGLNRQFPLSKMTINLNNPSANTFVLGTTVNTSLTSKSSAAQSTIKKVMETVPVPSSIVQQAVAEATALITAATHGHVVTTAEEQLIMDTNDVNTAKRVWRWNLNGFGYSSTGYNGTYKSAITMDGWIVGERIAANSISGDKLDITYKTSVTKEIADAEEAARSDAERYTDKQLKNYYTKSQVETSIKNTADSVLMSAKETSEQYVDGKLKNYSTSAEIKVATDKISQTVSKKVGYEDVISAINQSAETVEIKASKIKFEGLVTANSNFQILSDGSIAAKNATLTGQLKTDNGTRQTRVFGGGIQYYYKNVLCGEINPARYENDDNKTGVDISTTKKAITMTLGNTIKYALNNGANLNGLGYRHIFYDSVWVQNWLLADTVYKVNPYTGAKAEYTHPWVSDKRLKYNVTPSKETALEKIKKLDFVQFDWKEGQGHETLGLIADEVENIIPNAISITKQDGNCKYDNLKSIDIQTMLVYALKAIKELDYKVGEMQIHE